MAKTPHRVAALFEPMLDVLAKGFERNPDAEREFQRAVIFMRAAGTEPDGSPAQTELDMWAWEGLVQTTLLLCGDPDVRGWFAPEHVLRALWLRAYFEATDQLPAADADAELPPALGIRVKRLWPGQRTHQEWRDGKPLYDLDYREVDRLKPYVKWLQSSLSGEAVRWAGRRADSGELSRDHLIQSLGGARGKWQAMAKTRRPPVTQGWVADIISVDRTRLCKRLAEEGIDWQAVKRWIKGTGPEPW